MLYYLCQTKSNKQCKEVFYFLKGEFSCMLLLEFDKNANSTAVIDRVSLLYTDFVWRQSEFAFFVR